VVLRFPGAEPALRGDVQCDWLRDARTEERREDSRAECFVTIVIVIEFEPFDVLCVEKEVADVVEECGDQERVMHAVGSSECRALQRVVELRHALAVVLRTHDLVERKEIINGRRLAHSLIVGTRNSR